jgi:hypothetical protein
MISPTITARTLHRNVGMWIEAGFIFCCTSISSRTRRCTWYCRNCSANACETCLNSGCISEYHHEYCNDDSSLNQPRAVFVGRQCERDNGNRDECQNGTNYVVHAGVFPVDSTLAIAPACEVELVVIDPPPASGIVYPCTRVLLEVCEELDPPPLDEPPLDEV